MIKNQKVPRTPLHPFSKLLAPARLPRDSLVQSKFYVGESSHDRPDWLRVDLTLGTSVFLSIYLTKQRNKGVLEYKRNGLE
uniref:NADH dehydrogenase [ubiquinone] 1 subunit C1, mitochondrial n=2 Tax=Canis lupus TaxID=9612 RepID=A0A8C0SNY2_CANLF